MCLHSPEGGAQPDHRSGRPAPPIHPGFRGLAVDVGQPAARNQELQHGIDVPRFRDVGEERPGRQGVDPNLGRVLAGEDGGECVEGRLGDGRRRALISAGARRDSKLRQLGAF